MGEQNQVLIRAIYKLAIAGEQAGFSVEEMIELLTTGVRVETLLDLVCSRLDCSIVEAKFTTQATSAAEQPQSPSA
jgi:hypothetical protein